MPDSNLTPSVAFNVTDIRRQFPAFSHQNINEQTSLSSPFVYLDNAATTQKPQCVIDTLTRFYAGTTANVNRTSHEVGRTITTDFEAARQTVADFLKADVKGIVWTRGTTESINLVAYSFAKAQLKKGDEILVSEMEHHANLIPWQLIAQETGAKMVKIPMKVADFILDMTAFDALLNPKTKLVAIGHISNVTGTRHPIETIIEKAHAFGAKVLVDGAQAVAHEEIDLTKLNVDFYAFSGHKLFAPSGIGVLYIKPSLLDSMPPWQGGGKMIDEVTFEKSSFLKSAAKFEAGTPNIAGALALAAAINWFRAFDLKAINTHIDALQKQLVLGISKLDGLRFLNEKNHAGIVSFVIDGVHPSDLATLLDQQQIAARAGHHCAYPLMQALNINGCLRLSLALYNTQQDIELCIQSIHKSCELL